MTDAIREAYGLLSGGLRAEIKELQRQRQRQDELIVDLRRDLEEVRRQAMPRPRSVPSPDRRRARPAERKFAGGQS